jgi:hypothetical protein
MIVDSLGGVGLPWKGSAIVDGQPWPVLDDQTVWMPAGAHSLEPAPRQNGLRLLRLNGDLKSARVLSGTSIEFSYRSTARAIAVLDAVPKRIQIDGADEIPRTSGPATLLLPRGQHVVTVFVE